MAKGRRPFVVDTNVVVTANRRDGGTYTCASRCAQALLEIRAHGSLVLDDGDRILKEYRSYLNYSGQPYAVSVGVPNCIGRSLNSRYVTAAPTPTPTTIQGNAFMSNPPIPWMQLPRPWLRPRLIAPLFASPGHPGHRQRHPSYQNGLRKEERTSPNITTHPNPRHPRRPHQGPPRPQRDQPQDGVRHPLLVEGLRRDR
jgi:hypothetical protein